MGWDDGEGAGAGGLQSPALGRCLLWGGEANTASQRSSHALSEAGAGSLPTSPSFTLLWQRTTSFKVLFPKPIFLASFWASGYTLPEVLGKNADLIQKLTNQHDPGGLGVQLMVLVVARWPQTHLSYVKPESVSWELAWQVLLSGEQLIKELASPLPSSTRKMGDDVSLRHASPQGKEITMQAVIPNQQGPRSKWWHWF